MKYNITIIPEGWEKPLIFMLLVLIFIFIFSNPDIKLDNKQLQLLCEQLNIQNANR